jgi:hypothetical protein
MEIAGLVLEPVSKKLDAERSKGSFDTMTILDYRVYRLLGLVSTTDNT